MGPFGHSFEAQSRPQAKPLQQLIGNGYIYAPLQGFGLHFTFSARKNVQEG
jgi:hypothetical protein